MTDYVRLIIDRENAMSVLAAAAGTIERDRASLFIPGGARMSAATFVELSTLGLEEATARVEPILGASTLPSLLRDLRRRVRRNPLTIAVVIEYILALRAELHDLARIIWGVAMVVPRHRVIDGLATP